MSRAERIAAEHQFRDGYRGRSCRCGATPPDDVREITAWERRHIAEVTAETIAADLLAVDPVEWALAGPHAGDDAARIARGADK